MLLRCYQWSQWLYASRLDISMNSAVHPLCPGHEAWLAYPHPTTHWPWRAGPEHQGGDSRGPAAAGAAADGHQPQAAGLRCCHEWKDAWQDHTAGQPCCAAVSHQGAAGSAQRAQHEAAAQAALPGITRCQVGVWWGGYYSSSCTGSTCGPAHARCALLAALAAVTQRLLACMECLTAGAAHSTCWRCSRSAGRSI